jgi:hypothetical protein
LDRLSRRGGLRTPAREASAWPRHVPGRPQASGLIIGCKCNAPACVRPVFADAQSASLRENHLSRHLRVCARKAISPWTVHPWRGGLRTPAGMAMPSPKHWPLGPPGVRLPIREHVVHRFASGQSLRTRRPRPSEKTAFRVIPGSSPQGHPCWASPPRRGGLRTPSNEASLAPRDRPIGPPGVHLPPMIMLCLGLPPALQRGRTECVPPRKPPFPSSPGFLRKVSHPGLPSWRGGLRTPARDASVPPGIAPLGHQAFICPR